MKWEEREILLVVKTYPERSTRYGNTVCTAGILEDTNEWVRIYPINWDTYYKKKLKKFIRFKAQISKNTKEKLKRKESYKIRESTIQVIDDSLTKTHIKGVWEERTKILEGTLSNSMEKLKDQFGIDKTSLGIIEPRRKNLKFLIEKPISQIEIDVMKDIQLNLYGEKIKKVDKIEYAFSYNYKCKGDNCKWHKMICIDWELIESFRKLRKRYKRPEELESKIRYKFFDWMINKRDLYFILGTTWKYPTWVIIGLYYPPKQRQKKMNSFFIT